MLKVVRKLRVEWGYCDASGEIHDTQFYYWMDQATHRLCDAAGFGSFAQYDNPDPHGFPAVSVGLELKQLPKHGQILTATSQISKIGTSSVRIEHVFEIATETIASGCEIRAYGMTHPDDPQKMQAVPIPENIKENLSRTAQVDTALG